MKRVTKKNELDVDFIKSNALTKEEVKALSEYIKKLKNKKQKIRKAA